MSFPSQVAFADELRALKIGIDADMAEDEAVTLALKTYSVPELRATIDEFLAAQEYLRTAYNAYLKAVDDARTSRKTAESFRDHLRAYLVSRHGATHPILAKYGFKPKGKRTISAATKALMVVRGKSTRKERGTMGKRQKSKIKGKVDDATLAKLLGSPEAKDKPAATPQAEAAKAKKR